MLPQSRRLISIAEILRRHRQPFWGSETLIPQSGSFHDRERSPILLLRFHSQYRCYHGWKRRNSYYYEYASPLLQRRSLFRRLNYQMSTSGIPVDLSETIQSEHDESTATPQRKDEQKAPSQIDLLQKIQVVNEIRKEDMRRQKAWCRTNFRKPQSTTYESFKEAMNAAKQYAVQSNQSTLQEIQHWQPYTEAQAHDFFQHLSSLHVMKEKELIALLDSFQHSLKKTSIFVVRKKLRGRRKDSAVTTFPRSSLTLLTLLKGLHNAASVTPGPSMPTMIIQFLLHRGTDETSPATIPETTKNDLDDASGDKVLRRSFHQSTEDYERMMTCLELARERMVLESVQASKRAGNHRPETEAAIFLCPDKTLQLASHLAYHLPCSIYQKFIDFLTGWTLSRTPHMRRVGSVDRIPFRDVLGTMYYSVVIRQVADYLLCLEMDVPMATKRTFNSKATAIYPYYTHQMLIVESQRFYRSSFIKRKALQDKFVALAMEVQNALLHGSPVIVTGEEEAPPTMQMVQGIAAETVHSVTGSNVDSSLDDEEGKSDQITEELGNLRPNSAVSIRQRRKIEVSMIEKLEESEIRPVAIRKQRKSAQVSLKQVHAIFEAISLQLPLADTVASSVPSEKPLLPVSVQSSTTSEHRVARTNGDLNGSSLVNPADNRHVSTSSPPSHSRMVFVDNLPIDIQDDRIMEVFSRCGDIEALTIYNRRPDLDPGPLPQAELTQRRSRQTKMTLSERKWQRPKTPVYGLITFATDDGARKAMDDSLQIFGMILQRHPVRSVPSWKMTKLYIEDIPEGQPCVELEYQLSYALEPNIFVCLDAGQDVKSTVNSCEIKFPSFEMAYESYVQLQAKLSIFAQTASESDSTTEIHSPCRINWIRTEKDAVKWWSRDYGFD